MFFFSIRHSCFQWERWYLYWEFIRMSNICSKQKLQFWQKAAYKHGVQAAARLQYKNISSETICRAAQRFGGSWIRRRLWLVQHVCYKDKLCQRVGRWLLPPGNIVMSLLDWNKIERRVSMARQCAQRNGNLNQPGHVSLINMTNLFFLQKFI